MELLPLPLELNNIILYKYKGLSHPCSIIINNALKDFKEEIIWDLKKTNIWGDTYKNITDEILWENIINNKYTDEDIGSFIHNAFDYIEPEVVNISAVFGYNTIPLLY